MSYEEDDHIKISETEDSEFMEFPKEDDDTVLLSSIQAQFPNAIGLKYRGSSGAWRALRAVDNVLNAPKDGWGDTVYCLTVNESIKRKSVTSSDVERKRSRLNPLLQDMAVMNLPFQTTETELKEYFEKHYGDVHYCEVKTFRDTGKSRGYGFVRFKDELAAKEAASAEHHMHGRKVEVKLKQEKPMKLFVGRLPNGTTTEQLKEYFSSFGELSDVYIPTPFRNFGFITFATSDAGQDALRATHHLNGNLLNVVERNKETRDKQDVKNSFTEKDRGRTNSHNEGYTTKEYRSSRDSYDKRSNTSNYSSVANPPGSSLDPALKTMLLQYLASQ